MILSNSMSQLIVANNHPTIHFMWPSTWCLYIMSRFAIWSNFCNSYGQISENSEKRNGVKTRWDGVKTRWNGVKKRNSHSWHLLFPTEVIIIFFWLGQWAGWFRVLSWQVPHATRLHPKTRWIPPKNVLYSLPRLQQLEMSCSYRR